MANCWLGCDHATNSTRRSWRDGLSHTDSRRCATQLFEKAADYQAFEGVPRQTRDQSPIRFRADALSSDGTAEEGSLLARWPIERPPDGVERVNGNPRYRFPSLTV